MSDSVFTTRDHAWMQRALDLANRAEAAGEVPVGAVIVREDSLIGEGWNQCILRHDPSAHAEVMALRDAGRHAGNYRLPGCEMYVTLEPCAMCVSAAIHARITRLVFAASDPKTGALGGAYDLTTVHRHNHQILVQGGLLEGQAAERLRDFFRNRRLSR